MDKRLYEISVIYIDGSQTIQYSTFDKADALSWAEKLKLPHGAVAVVEAYSHLGTIYTRRAEAKPKAIPAS